jgi:hypothetical protein
MRADRLPFLLFALVLVAALAGLAGYSFADPDLWGHIRFGQDILDAGAVVRSDPYSFTSDRAWTNHEWLAEIVMAGAYRFGGVRGLLALSSGVAALVIFLVGRLLRRTGVGEPATFTLLAALFIALVTQLLVIRPQLFSVLLFTLMLMLLSEVEHGRERRLLWLGPVFAVWANLHGGWIVGLGVLGLWAGISVITGRASCKWSTLAVVVSIVGSAVNPYGWGLWVFLWETVGLGRADIREWQPALSHPAGFIIWVFGVIVLVVSWRRRNAAGVLPFIPSVVLGLLALRVVRLDAFFVLGAVMMLGPLWAGLGPERLPLSRQPTVNELLVVALMAITGLSLVGYGALRSTACLPVENNTQVMPEPELLMFARTNALNGRMVTWFDYGEYAIWHLAPQLKVSFDGRRETVYSNRVKEAHLRFYAGLDPAYPDEIGADYVWLPNRLPVVTFLLKRGWVPIFKGSRSIIFARAPGSYVNVPAFTGPRCFPGP